MRKSVAAAVIAASAASSACGYSRGKDAGPSVSRNYQVGDFTQIEVGGTYEVRVHTGAAASVSAKGPEKVIEELIVEVRGDKLIVHPKRHSWWRNTGWRTNQRVSLDINVPKLRGATLAGAGRIEVDKVQGDQFEGQIAGSGDLHIGSVDVARLKLGIAGAGSVKAGTGKAANAEYEIAGSGEMDGRNIAAQDIKVVIAGSGEIHAHATGAAEVHIAGSGDVDVTGGAKCTVKKAGSGNVRCS
jgi:hypothetical protein